VLAIVAAATTLTLGLALRGVSDQPYQQTRTATAGPDVVAEVSAGLSTAQVLPALTGALLGIPGGFALVSAVNKDGGPVTMPPVWWLAAAVLGTTAAVAAVTAAPAWLGTRRPAGEVLRSELA
jgi:hypothetical protein